MENIAIEIKKENEHKFIVTIEKENSKFEYEVTLDEEYYQYLTKGRILKEDLIKKSFEFLLQREAKESIFSKFNLKIISHYFPEYEEKIKLH